MPSSKEGGSNSHRECQTANTEWINNGMRVAWFSWLCPSLSFPQTHYQLPGRRTGTTGWQGRSKQDGRDMRLEAVVSHLAEQIDCDNIIPSSNAACAKSYKMPSGIKAVDFSRAPSKNTHKALWNTAVLVITSKHVQWPSPHPVLALSRLRSNL